MTRGSDPVVLREAYRTGANYLDRVALFDHQRPRIAFHEWVLDHVDLRDGDRVVDVGCGPGLYVRVGGSSATRSGCHSRVASPTWCSRRTSCITWPTSRPRSRSCAASCVPVARSR